MKYIRELDSIRAIAVFTVIVLHWHPGYYLEYATSRFDGVAMFLVLSGFLITGILLENRNKAETMGVDKMVAYKNFYIRRALRIFPIYYLLLLLVFTVGHKHQTNGLIYYLTYTSNFYIYHTKTWGELTHLWSLAVEEQFYLVWPWLILFLNKKFLLPVISLLIIVGLIAPFYMPDSDFTYITTVSCLDALALGALLSWLYTYKLHLLQKLYPYVLVMAIVTLFAIITELYLNIRLLHQRIYTSIITFWLITYVITNKGKRNSVLSVLLNNRFLISIGKISYGIYLYHHLFPFYTTSYFARLNSYLPEIITNHPSALLFIENFCLLLIISWLSWVLIEKQFLQLKKYFEYNDSKKRLKEVEGIHLKPAIEIEQIKA